MAERRRPSKSRGKANTRNNKKVNKAVDKKRFGDTIYDEIILLTLMILSLIVMVSLFTSVMGVFGQVVSSFLKGLFGAGAIVLPIILIAFCVWVILNREHRFFVAKAIGVGMFTISISIMFHLITEGGTIGENSFFTQAKEFYTNGSSINGGLIGGFLAYWLYTGIGWGSYIVAFALVIISIMLGTGKSLFVGIGILIDIIDEKYQGVKETREKNREFEEELYEDEEKKAFYLQKREEQYYAKLEKRENRKGLVNILLGDNTGKNPVKEFSEFEEEKAVIRPKVEEAKREEPKIIEKPREHKMIDISDIDLSPTKEKLIEVIGSTTRFEDEPIQIFGVMDEEVPEIEGELQLEDTSFKNPFLKKEATKNNMPPVLQVIKPPVREEVKEEIKEPIKEPIFQPIKTPEIMQDPIIEPLPKEEELIINIANEEPEPIEEFSQELEEEIFAPMETIEPEEIEEIVEIEEVATPEEVVASATVKEELVENLAIVKKQEEIEEDKYIFPPIDILGKKPQTNDGETKTDMIANAKKLEETLASFGVEAKVIQINKGPTVTRYELTPKQGVKVSKIVNLADDIALNLAAMGIRIEAPIPGKAAVGIEVPNKVTQSVYLRSVLDSDNFKKFPSKLAFALGEDIAGNAIVTDIAKMPHLLIAGATGSGKSVCINTLITSILYKADPKEVKLLMVDPKVVELSVYNGIPHLLIPVVTDPKKAAGALNWAVKEMLGRYQSFAEFSVRDIKGYNAMKEEKQETDLMPQIVVIIDELADLMMAAPGEVEDSICRLAQMARAAGIHLIIATQRPSVDVITGVIKANIPSRLAFAVSSGTDSRTILDGVGAEKLLGKGDMLFYPVGMSKPVRIQGAFVTDKEVEHIVDFVKRGKNTTYDTKMIETITASAKSAEAGSDSDEFFDAALDLVVEKQKGSTSMIQRQFRIGYNRAARIMEELEARGFVGPEDGSKPRKVLLTKMQLDEMRYPVNDDIND